MAQQWLNDGLTIHRLRNIKTFGDIGHAHYLCHACVRYILFMSLREILQEVATAVCYRSGEKRFFS